MIAERIAKVNAANRSTLSFEFFPPRDDAAAAALEPVVDALVSIRPDFVSVTYGAGGSNQSRSFEMVGSLASRVPTIGHLTCVGASAADLVKAVHTLEELGAEAILALRGDVPAARPEVADLTELHSALELMALINENSTIELGVAAFPERHPDSPSIEHDIEVLLKKQAAGATFAITQLFFFAEDYLSFAAKARAAGVKVPIMPGILPIASIAQVERMTKLSHSKKPDSLIEAMQSVATDEQAEELGYQYTLSMCRELLEAGVPGLHIFCLNQASTPLRLVEDLQLR